MKEKEVMYIDIYLKQLFGAMYYTYGRYNKTELLDHQQRGLNHYLKQPEDFQNRFEFNTKGYRLICHSKTEVIKYKHHDLMNMRLVIRQNNFT